MSWQPVDLLAIETTGPPEPTLSGLGYPGTLAIVYAEPEGLKSWLELVVCLEAIRAGRAVIWVDFEMNASSLVNRLRALGATDDEVCKFTYLQPMDPLTDPDERAKAEALMTELDPAVVVIDAMAGALALHGLNQNDADDIERLYRVILRPFRTPRTALRIIDHVVKDRETQGRWPTGSQRKLGGADVGLKLEVVKPFSRGGNGLAKIRVTKDRPGGLARPYVAEFALHSDPVDGAVTWTIAPAAGSAGEQADEGSTWRPTWYMEQISRVLEASKEPMNRGDIVTAVGRKRAHVLEAINHLLIAGNVSESVGARGAKVCTLVQPFRVPEPFPDVPENASGDPFPVPNSKRNGNGNDSDDPEVERLLAKYGNGS